MSSICMLRLTSMKTVDFSFHPEELFSKIIYKIQKKKNPTYIRNIYIYTWFQKNFKLNLYLCKIYVLFFKLLFKISLNIILVLVLY